MMNARSIRAFVGIDIDIETRKKLLAIQRDCLKLHQLSSVKAVDPQTVHITLDFLGYITPTELTTVSAALSSIAFHPFFVTLCGIGVFPSAKKMRIVYVGLNDFDDLKALYTQVTKTLQSGRASNTRFAPHITLGRVKRTIPDELKQLAAYIAPLSASYFGRLDVSSFQLKRSTLTPNGPIYETVEEFKL
jgi:RNA 2',3'-cyclic 3'-phosphodiesterase